jgi:hypothetical protein
MLAAPDPVSIQQLLMPSQANTAPRPDEHDAEPSGEKALAPAAQRALAEASERREAYRAKEAAMPPEKGGRGGLEPGRYGDWEVKGIACDF